MEDVATVGLLWLAYEYPYAAAAVAVVLLAFSIWLLLIARKVIRSLFRPKPPPAA